MKKYPPTPSYPFATLRTIAARPQQVADIQPRVLHRLTAGRAINVKDGVAVITRIGVRQLRNAS